MAVLQPELPKDLRFALEKDPALHPKTLHRAEPIVLRQAQTQEPNCAPSAPISNGTCAQCIKRSYDPPITSKTTNHDDIDAASNITFRTVCLLGDSSSRSAAVRGKYMAPKMDIFRKKLRLATCLVNLVILATRACLEPLRHDDNIHPSKAEGTRMFYLFN